MRSIFHIMIIKNVSTIDNSIVALYFYSYFYLYSNLIYSHQIIFSTLSPYTSTHVVVNYLFTILTILLILYSIYIHLIIIISTLSTLIYLYYLSSILYPIISQYLYITHLPFSKITSIQIYSIYVASILSYLCNIHEAKLIRIF
jgi:hypothetical protein